MRKYSTGPISHGFSAVYTFLGQGKDSYSDMAVSYRAYLLENGTLQDKLKNDAVLALDIFMAAPGIQNALQRVYSGYHLFSGAGYAQ